MSDDIYIRWNNFQVKSTFQELREEKDFMDVTISCDGEQVKAHKVILSACSVTFRNLLKKNPAPVIDLLVRISVNHILKNIPIHYFIVQDVDPRDLTSILDWMYQGEVNIKQDHLNSFLALAEKLRVRGLCQNNFETSGPKQASPEPPRARDTSFTFTEPAIKRSLPSLAQESQDDEEVPIQEEDNSFSLLSENENFVPATQSFEFDQLFDTRHPAESTSVADTQELW